MLFEAMIVLIKGLVMILLLMGAAAYMTFLESVVWLVCSCASGPIGWVPWDCFSRSPMGSNCSPKNVFNRPMWRHLPIGLLRVISLFLALAAFVLIPIGGTVICGVIRWILRIADVNAGILFLLAFSSLAVYGIVLAGWSSNDRYSLIGGLRGTAQMISYEIPMGISLVDSRSFSRNAELNRNCRRPARATG